MFPLSIEGSVPLASTSPENINALLLRIENGLDEAHISLVVREDQEILFRGELLVGAFSQSQLSGLGNASIAVEPGIPHLVVYRASTVPRLVVITCGMTLFGALVAANGQMSALLAAPFLGFVLFSADYLMTRLRLQQLVSSAIADVSTGPQECPVCGVRYEPADYASSAAAWHCDHCGSDLPRVKLDPSQAFWKDDSIS